MSPDDLALRDAILGVEDPAERMYLLFEQVQRRLGAVGFDGLSATEVLVFCVWDFVNEVDNGGFDQFFANSSGDRADETLAALRAIGATRSAALLASLMARFGPAGPPRDRAERDSILMRLRQRDRGAFEAADTEHYAAAEPVWALAAAWCAAHREDLHVRA